MEKFRRQKTLNCEGAQQVGKTWLMKEFGRRYYEDTFFDEVQECPDALNFLKYFYENVNEYYVISAGSLLGTLLAQP